MDASPRAPTTAAAGASSGARRRSTRSTFRSPSAEAPSSARGTAGAPGAAWRRTAARIYSGYVDSLEYVSPRLGYQTSERGRLARLPDGRTLISSDDADSYLGQSWADARHGAAALFHTGLVVTDDGGAAW